MLAILTGDSPDAVGARSGIDPGELATAASLYRAAGQAALERHAGGRAWQQIHLRFDDWHAAEQVAAQILLPVLQQGSADELLASWFFIRKSSVWRLRFLPTERDSLGDAFTDQLLAAIGSRAEARGRNTVYEPEVHAFGGEPGMKVAHHLFHQDSRRILDHLNLETTSSPPFGRRELSVVLCSTMMRNAGLEWSEQGDVWARVAERRPAPPTPTPRQSSAVSSMHRLMSVDAFPTLGPVEPGPLRGVSGWMEAFARTGTDLADLARAGRLTRGLRSVLTRHVIFHWNRIGLPASIQGVLAHMATQVVFDGPGRTRTGDGS